MKKSHQEQLNEKIIYHITCITSRSLYPCELATLEQDGPCKMKDQENSNWELTKMAPHQRSQI